MTKTIEALRRTVIKEAALGNHIADTYFYQKTRSKKSRKKSGIPAKNITRISLILSLTAAAILLFFMVHAFLNASYIELVKFRFANSKIVKAIDGGVINKDIIRNFEFSGYAKNDSSEALRSFIVLNNPKKYSWAGISLDFKFPLDLTSRRIILSLRGTIGGEKANMILRDINNRAYRIKELYLSSRWQDEVIRLRGLRNNIDLSKIIQLRIESGYAGESGRMLDAPVAFTIYVKNLNITREESWI
ncbi:MAG: hypothetical protein Q8N91_06170 [Candidatus Omnitrophota bacterium]|nr:hypothetical protein [Candidatus Omnitrophota bacterium]